MNEKMRVSLSELLPIIEEQLNAGKNVCFTPNGISMQPMLYQGRDSVILSPTPAVLKKYDLPLYRRDDGQFVLHRIVKVNKDGTYTLCGDNQYIRENGISHSQVIGLVTAFTRKDKRISCKNPIYRLYCFFRVQNRYLYGLTMRIKGRIFKNKIQKKM